MKDDANGRKLRVVTTSFFGCTEAGGEAIKNRLARAGLNCPVQAGGATRARDKGRNQGGRRGRRAIIGDVTPGPLLPHDASNRRAPKPSKRSMTDKDNATLLVST